MDTVVEQEVAGLLLLQARAVVVPDWQGQAVMRLELPVALLV